MNQIDRFAGNLQATERMPLLDVLGMKAKIDQPEFFNSEFQMGSISMRTVFWK
ncbi:MAG: hypothetical protein K0M40_08615 [Prolixibacteraceae bacterium]|nr:hypothetical protein [Prolixibacteraceae bacterium]